MRLVRAPMRISYVGGGTDYPRYFMESPGGVIAAAINQFVYVYSNPLSEVADENFRFTYRESESVRDYKDFRHPVIREILRHLDWKSRDNFGTFSDLPSGIGLGGSSAFTVALAHLLLQKKEFGVSQMEISKLAVKVERDLLSEVGGIQDQYVATYGNLRSYDFDANKVTVSEPRATQDFSNYLSQRQILIWVGKTRSSMSHAQTTKDSILKNRKLFEETYKLYQDAKQIIDSAENNEARIYCTLRDSVKEGWKLKVRFTSELDLEVAEIISRLKQFGVGSYKLCGAGGTGFILAMGEPDEIENIKKGLTQYKLLNPEVSINGSEILISK